ncbi:NAD(P)H-binding protein [Streptomyces aurantiacus]|uniref:Putative NAD(P)H azoreductase n=1 Tax=Streptomyces aurantiacus JA 4570 TaxID=1286094 RepID=S3ZIF9_9ACTN|nr:NAD(P)H-binding protein [Streptomyces aurantiacus]EPH42469.1 putative NAD(P)H azoreductase [Streptomyces aurantiacus JA 4570]
MTKTQHTQNTQNTQNTRTTKNTYLVAGATGTVGREVVRELLERGQAVRALTRDPAKADFPEGVETVRGDLADPATLKAALQGVTGLHLITFTGGYEPLETGPEILALAREAGVRRITVLHGGDQTPLQAAVCAGELDWTVVMPVEFMANSLEWAEAVRAEGEVRAPFADRLSALVHEGDIGAVIAVALTEEGHAGQEYVVTGPQALTVREKVAALAEARGSEIALVELTEEEAAAGMRAQGHDDATIAWLLDVYKNTPPVGRTVTDTVPRLTGRPARTFAQWAREHAASFGRA